MALGEGQGARHGAAASTSDSQVHMTTHHPWCRRSIERSLTTTRASITVKRTVTTTSRAGRRPKTERARHLVGDGLVVDAVAGERLASDRGSDQLTTIARVVSVRSGVTRRMK